MATYIGTPGVGTDNTASLGADDIVREIAREVLIHDRNTKSPLLTYLTLTKMAMEDSSNPFFEWQENQYDYGTHTVAGGIASALAGATQVVNIDSPSTVVGDSFWEASSEQFFIVTAVGTRTSTHTDITIKRLPTTSATNAVSGSVTLMSQGTLAPEGAYFPDAKSTRPTAYGNNIQATTCSIDITDVLSKTATYYGSKWETNKDAALTQFRADIERNILTGVFSTTTSFAQAGVNGTTTSTLRTTRGIVNMENIQNDTYSGNFDEATMDELCGATVWGSKFSGSPEKFFFFGRDSHKNFNKDIKDKLRVLQMGKQLYGLTIGAYQYGEFTAMIMTEREFWEVPQYQTAVLVVDPKFIKLRKYPGNFMEMYDTSPTNRLTKSLGVVAYYGVQSMYGQAHTLMTQV